jgi:predicted nucleic acid-binding protein
MLYDSSVLIDYLAGEDAAVTYVDDHFEKPALAPPLVLFEIYQGEVYKSGDADFDSVDRALGWVRVVEGTAESARAAAELQARLRRDGTPLAARDALVAGTARALGERLVVADADFDVPGLDDALDATFL